MNNRGDVQSIIIIIVILFALGLSAMLFSKVFLAVTGEMKNMDEFQDSNKTIDTIEFVEDKTIPFLDYLFFFSFIALSIGVVISSIYIDTHPALMMVFIIALIISIILAGVFANVFVSVGESDSMSSTYNQFTLTKTLITHFPLAVFIVGLLVAMILYGKGGSSSPV